MIVILLLSYISSSENSVIIFNHLHLFPLVVLALKVRVGAILAGRHFTISEETTDTRSYIWLNEGLKKK